MMFDGLGSSATHIKNGRLKAIAVAGDKRAPGFGDLPTSAEAGLPSYKVSTWYGLWAPRARRRTPLDRMAAELQAAFASQGDPGGLGQHRRRTAYAVGQGLQRFRRLGDAALGRGGQGRQHQDGTGLGGVRRPPRQPPRTTAVERAPRPAPETALAPRARAPARARSRGAPGGRTCAASTPHARRRPAATRCSSRATASASRATTRSRPTSWPGRWLQVDPAAGARPAHGAVGAGAARAPRRVRERHRHAARLLVLRARRARGWRSW